MLSFVFVFVCSDIFIVTFTLLILGGRERCSVLYCVTGMRTGLLSRSRIRVVEVSIKRVQNYNRGFHSRNTTNYRN